MLRSSIKPNDIQVWNSSIATEPNCDENNNCTVSSSDTYVTFSFDASQVAALVGTSYTSEKQAAFNLEHEVGTTSKLLNKWKPLSFEQVVTRNENEWDEYLNRVQVSGDNFSKDDFDAKRVSFYTALYRTLINPHAWFECSQYAQNGQCDASYTENKDGSRHYDYIFHRSPFDQEGFRNGSDGKPLVYNGYMFSDEGTWDVYRSKYPFYSLVFPDVESKIIQGYVNTYREGGWLPKWASPGYKKSMTGTHGDCIVADAYLRGIKGFSPEEALDAAWKDFSVNPKESAHCINGHTCGRVEFSEMKEHGYIPSYSSPYSYDEHTAGTLDFAYDNACIANMATVIAESTTDAMLKQKASDYAKQAQEESDLLVGNLFYSGEPLQVEYTDGREPEGLTGLFLPKDANGNWVRAGSDQELYQWGRGFNEGGPFQFMFYMQYDIPKLASMFGKANLIEDSRVALEQQLDKFFTSKSDDVSGGKYMIHEGAEQQHIGLGQFGINNQPSFGYAYEYNCTDSPWKAQCILRNAMDPNRAETYHDYDCFGEGKSAGVSTKSGQEIYSLFGTGPQGWLGDEDTGSMSAWYASSAIGLHPVPGTDKIDFGSPIFNKVKISIPAYDEQPAKELTIDAKDNSQQNIYVNAISLDGEQLDLAESNYTINQSELYKNGNTATLVFSMSKDHS